MAFLEFLEPPLTEPHGADQLLEVLGLSHRASILRHNLHYPFLVAPT